MSDRPSAARKTLRVLLLDKDAVRRVQIETCLRNPGREELAVSSADTVADAIALAHSQELDCVILAHRLDDGISLEALEACDECLLTIPVIGLDTWRDPSLIIAYTRAGCVDFVEPAEILHGDLLRRRVSHVISRFQRRAMKTIIERKQLADAILGSQEQLISMARIDPLMGVCNRAVFDDMHPVFHDASLQAARPYAVVMVDVDQFKAYNDHFGHVAGDDALRRVAASISANLRDCDFVARYGGEELVVLLDDVGPDEAMAVVERLRHGVEQLQIEHAASELGVVTVSAGVAVFDPDAAVPRRALVLEADAILYRAKLEGRNRALRAGPSGGDVGRSAAA